MISKIHGKLESVHDNSAYIDTPMGLTYQVMLPAFAEARLIDQEGQPITLHTLAYFESTAQGATMFPRLAGFATPADRAFYELFVTVKGIGYRRALRAMALPPAQIAAAIADRDVKLLQTLPEIGRRTAETIAVTLKDKVDPFVAASAYPGAGPQAQTPDGAPAPADIGVAREALEVLLQLGESRADAVQWIDRVLATDERVEDAQSVVAEVYRLKAGG